MKNEDELTRLKPGGSLEVIRKRPMLYLEARNFIRGYTMALLDHNLADADDVLPRQLHEWVARRLQFKTPSSIREMILTRTNHDEVAALNKFFELYDEFRNAGVST